MSGISSITLADFKGVLRPKKVNDRGGNILPSLEVKNGSGLYKDKEEMLRNGIRRSTQSNNDSRTQKVGFKKKEKLTFLWFYIFINALLCVTH